METKISIIVLDYMKGQKVVDNVRSMLKQERDFGVQIFVVDNSCSAENKKVLMQLENFDNVSLQFNEKNLGYPKAHNIFNDKLVGEYVMVVNPDILWKEPDAIKKMKDYMDAHPEIGILGPKQINQDGTVAMTIRAFAKFYLQVARRTFFRNIPGLKKKVAYDEMRHLDYDKIQDVDWIQSSCIIVRKKLWEDVGGLNEKYFLFMSDVEVCLEAWKSGYRVVYYPVAKVYADGIRVSAGGFKKFFQSWVLRQHVVDSIKYRFKHFFDKNPREEYYRRGNNLEK